MLQDIVDPDWILQPALAPALDAMAEQGLVFDALVRPVHLARVREVARRHPRLRIVIDHGAKPAIAGHERQPWDAAMERIAGETEAMCKLSGLLTEAGPAAGDPRQVLPWMEHLLRSFGPRRLLWGSDWPMLELAGRYEGWWALCRDFAAPLGGNAACMYRLDLQPAAGTAP